MPQMWPFPQLLIALLSFMFLVTLQSIMVLPLTVSLSQVKAVNDMMLLW